MPVRPPTCSVAVSSHPLGKCTPVVRHYPTGWASGTLSKGAVRGVTSWPELPEKGSTGRRVICSASRRPCGDPAGEEINQAFRRNLRSVHNGRPVRHELWPKWEIGSALVVLIGSITGRQVREGTGRFVQRGAWSVQFTDQRKKTRIQLDSFYSYPKLATESSRWYHFLFVVATLCWTPPLFADAVHATLCFDLL